MASAYTEKAFEDVVEAGLWAGGWQPGSRETYDRALALDPRELLTFIEATQPRAWEKLVARDGADAAATRARFVKLVAEQIDLRGTIDVLRRGVKSRGVKLALAFFKPAHGLTTELIEHYEANRCTVVRQLVYSSTVTNELDIALFVNGVPVATAELKNPLTGQGVNRAIEQYRVDRDANDQLLSRRAVVHFAVDPDLVSLTTRLAGDETVFLPFNKGSEQGGAGNPANPDGHRTAYLWEEVWQRDAWLDILHRFVHAEPHQGVGAKRRGATVIFPRYHQWDAVCRLRADAYERGSGHNYLVEHSAGSGKSNTIGWLAHQLSTLHDDAERKVFTKVVVITDRVVLDRQLQETIFQFDHTPGVVVKVDRDATQLADALQSSQAQVIVTTLQKFPFVVLDEAVELTKGRYAVIVDEAHSSQTGETAKALKSALGAGTSDAEAEAALSAAEAEDAEQEAERDPEELILREVESRGRQPNLSYFAFTATPKQRTLELFGTLNASGDYEPFHLYSMRQAIEEEFILDVLSNYLTYRTYFKLARAASEDPQLPRAKAARAIARFVSLHPHNLAQKAEIVVEHFLRVTATKIGGRGKAMLVTRSRLHAVRYKLAVDEYIAHKAYGNRLRTLVAFSGTVGDGGLDHTEMQMNDIPEGQLPKEFGSRDYGLLIVAEKYQTGYDQPLLHTMYVDKKLEGVRAVQTLSRLNRTFPGKDDTFVLDFANEADDIQQSFKPFFDGTIAEPTDPNLVYNAQTALEAFGVIAGDDVDAFVAAFVGAGEDEHVHARLYQHLDPARRRFLDLDADHQEEFRAALTRFLRIYAFLAQVVPYGDVDLEKLYLYGRFLALRLPKKEERGLDVSERVVLTHLRTQYKGERNLSLAQGDGKLPGFTGQGTGPQNAPDALRLSEIIHQLNERFGTTFAKADQLYFDQLEEEMAGDEELQSQALANTLDNFRFGFERHFDDKVVERREANEELFNRILDDKEFSDVVRDYLARRVYDRLRDAA